MDIKHVLDVFCFCTGRYSDNGKPTALAYHGLVSSANVLASTHH